MTDGSERERFYFFHCLNIYEYDDAELKNALSTMSNNLLLYMQDFNFNSINTKLSEADKGLADELTSYFKRYKLQKLINRIYPEFLGSVNQYALSRPYNKLQPRSSIISHMDKNNMQLFFFDALGVEYVAFILAKCEEYGLA